MICLQAEVHLSQLIRSVANMSCVSVESCCLLSLAKPLSSVYTALRLIMYHTTHGNPHLGLESGLTRISTQVSKKTPCGAPMHLLPASTLGLALCETSPEGLQPQL